MSLAQEREKRNNAGARMARLLDAEEEDDFYKTTYGGFTEEANDDDYESEKSDSDDVDSDFDIDEDDEIRSDLEDDGEPKRKKRVVTKAYKEPKKPDRTTKPKKERTERQRTDRSSTHVYPTEPRDKKSLRHSTQAQSQAVTDREKERKERDRIMKEIAAKRNVSEVRRLTQEELLAEAKVTEQINLKSLATYQRLELEKKKARVTKQVYKGPIIRYQSVTMPLIEELPAEAEINVDGDTDNNDSEKKSQPQLHSTEKCSRTFITFTDQKVFSNYFRKQKTKPPVKQYCPVTRLQAKYFDPITQTPYANAQAFKIIRDAYAQQIQQQQQADSQQGLSDSNKRQKLQIPTDQAVKV